MATEAVPVTVEVLTKALQNAAPPWYSSGSFSAFFGVFLGGLIGFVGNWYLKRMDRNFWLQQKRLEWKWQCYSQLAENFGELHSLIVEEARISNRISNQAGGELLLNERNRIRTSIRERAELCRRYGSIARIVVPAEVRTFLTSFADRWNEAHGDAMAQGRAAWEAWNGILDHARVDLLNAEREDRPDSSEQTT